MSRFLQVCVFCVSVAGCSLAPQTALPPPPVPASWPMGDAFLAQSEAALPAVSYTELFRDPRLLALIDAALADNRDLRIAYADLAAARAQVRVVRAGQFPSVGVGAGATASDEEGGSRFDISAGVSGFELDLFGRLRNATESERNRAFATEAVARTVRVALVAEIATTYATYAADRDLLAIARATADNARESVRLTRLRLEGGVAPRTDLARAEQVLAAAEQSIAEQTASLAQDVNALRLLVGRDIEPALLPASLAEIAGSYAPLPAGTDSRVLLRRPDVIEAEYRLRAANADIGAARARLFPTLSLTGLLGLASTALGDLVTGGAFSARAGADAAFTIFDAGGRRAGVEVTEAQRDAALAQYEGAIQTAFREVADALADQGTLGERARAAAANSAAAATEARLTEARYRAGVDNFLDNLVAQRSLFAARRQQVAVELAALANRATLYRVLGGDRAASPGS
ncbi:efflux transporter outer membrane subunit [Qipengyuania sediminis]|uniref:efflux transporter outer membrane subunit n=1 Tax=Qipengyuania sediminis TaxID=1532023 RepID=UPI0010598467|nr:efflux transporter outer membrane subunit [Qipengyuania sediminis]